MNIQDDKMRIALDGLVKAERPIFSAISELRRQDYTTEADALQVVLDALLIETNAAIVAVNL